MRHALDASHVDQLVSLYGEAWWAVDRTCADVKRMLDASDVLIAVVEVHTDVLAAFARALTDEVYFAIVLDVIVARDFQKRGLGRLLLDTVVTHPSLARVRSLELVCQPDLIPFYQRWGFDHEVGSSTLMRRVRQA